MATDKECRKQMVQFILPKSLIILRYSQQDRTSKVNALPCGCRGALWAMVPDLRQGALLVVGCREKTGYRVQDVGCEGLRIKKFISSLLFFPPYPIPHTPFSVIQSCQIPLFLQVTRVKRAVLPNLSPLKQLNRYKQLTFCQYKIKHYKIK